MSCNSKRTHGENDTNLISLKKKPPIVPQKQNSSFAAGSIVRIRLTKFLTYDSVEFRTGPSLNVIIGPNGTGKSAVVCAICLGLAGKTSTLGRASELKDFIKYGASKALIEIELFNPHSDTNHIICREITNNNTSHWWCNGEPATLKMVEELVSRLNIQVGNLCQFLPQEKVADFARMTQQELLENTEKSVGRLDLFENHQLLKTARQTARVIEQDVLKLRKDLNQEKQKNSRLEQDVKSYRDRKTFLEKVDVLKMKKPWLEYGILKAQFERAKEEKDLKQQVLKKEIQEIAPLEAKHKTMELSKLNLEKAARDMSQKIQVKAKDIYNQINSMTSANDQINEAKGEFDSKVKEEESREKKLCDLKEQLKSLQTSLSQIESADANHIVEQLDRINDELRTANNRMTKEQTEGDRLRRDITNKCAEIKDLETQIKRIRDVNNRRLETLRTLHAHTYEAVVWLRANQNIFKHSIHEPMIISLNMMNAADARLLEAHVSFNDLRSFICQDPDDLDLFMRKVKNDLKLRVNIVKAPPQPANSFQPKNDISYYQKYGFERYLQNTFTCPEPVMSFLCLQYRVHTIPVGSTIIQTNIQKIMSECPELTNFYTPNVHYSIKTSKYSTNKSSSNSALKEPRALVDSINVEREQELNSAHQDAIRQHKQMEEEYKLIQNRLEELTLQINQLREEKRNVMKQKEERKNLINQITTKEQRIQQVIKERMNMEDERQKLKLQLKKIVHYKLDHLHKFKNLVLECVQTAIQRGETSLVLVKCVGELSTLEVQLRNVNQKHECLKRQVEELQQNAQDLKQQAKDKLLEAKKLAGLGLNDHLEEMLTARGVWEEFKSAPNRLDDLDNEIHSMQARAEVMFLVDEQVVKEFENRQKEIFKLEKSLQEVEARQESHQEDITQAKRRWLQPLNELIQEVNTSFSYFFSCMNCCGEVSLSEPENPEDYEKYGVCIRVKFRDDESLEDLTAHRQSGGERSVATVLYMMALQELTKCPFRCVDEINQGMDPNNERRIFQLVVQTVCKKTSSQYFLLTPKLLPDLDYDHNMMVLCIYNGLYLLDHKVWKLRKFIKKRENMKES